MTISSHPRIKLLLAVIAAIVVGIISDSWGWGIATFFIVMFLFIWVASWIFGDTIKGKVEVTDELEELLNKLEIIGNIKNTLPFTARGWCNSLGLFVQLREKGGLSRLEAGDDKYHSQIDAWQDYFQGRKWILRWQVKKYNPGDWEKLVDPTLSIATWLSTYGGLPEEYIDSFNGAIEVFKKEGHLKLPVDINEIRSCERCKYGPNVVACQMGRTGKPRSPVDLSLNPFGPQPPTQYFLTRPNEMPCFEPKTTPEARG